jgi:nucleotide-binding universal stress UspA family protein
MAPLDGSELAECVLDHVEGLARATQPREIILVRVVEPVAHNLAATEFGPTVVEIGVMEDREKQAAASYLARIKSRLAPLAVPVRTAVLYGKAAETLVDFARDSKVDLIVMSTHGRSGIQRWVMGSVAERVVKNSAAPVMIVRAPGAGVEADA